ncbi:MAG: uroporphyrinogen-III synthase [Phyllobacterium sp.]
MGKRVLVTRPEPGASRTAERLLQAGHVPVVMPLTQTEGLAVSRPLEPFDVVAVTSASAIRHLDSRFLRGLVGHPCYVVGEATAQIVREAGFSDLVIGDGYGRSLARILAKDIPAGKHVLYLTGKVRSPDFEVILSGANIPVTPIEVYDTKKVSYTTDIVRGLIGDATIDVTPVYSAFGAALLAEIAASGEFSHLFEKTMFLCISQRISDVLAQVPADRKCVAQSPNEDALFNLLERGFA